MFPCGSPTLRILPSAPPLRPSWTAPRSTGSSPWLDSCRQGCHAPPLPAPTSLRPSPHSLSAAPRDTRSTSSPSSSPWQTQTRTRRCRREPSPKEEQSHRLLLHWTTVVALRSPSLRGSRLHRNGLGKYHRSRVRFNFFTLSLSSCRMIVEGLEKISLALISLAYTDPNKCNKVGLLRYVPFVAQLVIQTFSSSLFRQVVAKRNLQQTIKCQSSTRLSRSIKFQSRRWKFPSGTESFILYDRIYSHVTCSNSDLPETITTWCT